MSENRKPGGDSPELTLVDDANHQALVDPLLHSKVHIVSKLTRQWWHRRYGVITQHDEDVMLGAAVALYCETYGWPRVGEEPKLPRAVEAGMRVGRTNRALVLSEEQSVALKLLIQEYQRRPGHINWIALASVLEMLDAQREAETPGHNTPAELRPLEEAVIQTALVYWQEFYAPGTGREEASARADLLEAAKALHEATAKVLKDQSGVT